MNGRQASGPIVLERLDPGQPLHQVTGKGAFGFVQLFGQRSDGA